MRLLCRVWFPVLILGVLLAGVALAVPDTSHGHNPRPDLSICRSHVLPCQKDISIPVGGSQSVDLVVETSHPGDVAPIVAWEAHLRFTNPAAPRLCSNSALPPVQTLPWWGDEWEVSDLYTPQNLCDPDSGRLDYSVLLLGQDSGGATRAISPTLSQNRTVFGSMVLHGQTPGVSRILAPNTAGSPAQLVHLDSQEQVGSTVLRLPTDYLASIIVGPVLTTRIEAFLTAPAWASDRDPKAFPGTVTVTLWQHDAAPPWRGGSAQPAVSLMQVPVTRIGWVYVDDLPPSLLSPGEYDLRVKAEGATPQLVAGLTFPDQGETQHTVSVSIPPLRYGDLDGDELVDSRDLKLFRDAFGDTREKDSPFPAADFNRDSIIDATDFSILANSYGSRGE